MKLFSILALVGALLFVGTATGAEPKTFSYGQDSKQSLNVYVPAKAPASGSLPVLVWVHGGGWRNGDKDNRSGKALCQAWADQGTVAVGLDYRLTPAVKHPAHVEDVAAGVAWVHTNIATHGGDPRRVFLLGHSAGAHLVALVATAPQFLQAHDLAPSDALAGVMPIDTASYDLTATRAPIVRKMISDAFGDNQPTLVEASPLLQVRKHPAGCPAFIIATVKQRPEAVEESESLRAALPKAELIVVDYPGSGQLAAHGLIAKHLADFDKDMTKRLLAFVLGSKESAQ
ncbi:MAG: alpha/beta hydrolase [Planctomycetes bacterium]|nr:alpha/beta hydrolase [Planctomycetota bacterium]